MTFTVFGLRMWAVYHGEWQSGSVAVEFDARLQRQPASDWLGALWPAGTRERLSMG